MSALTGVKKFILLARATATAKKESDSQSLLFYEYKQSAKHQVLDMDYTLHSLDNKKQKISCFILSNFELVYVYTYVCVSLRIHFNIRFPFYRKAF